MRSPFVQAYPGKAVGRLVKRGISACKRPCFTPPFAAFCMAIGRILQSCWKQPSFYLFEFLYCTHELRCVDTIFFVKTNVCAYLVHAAFGLGLIACLGY